jgi:AraC-like DNA-binding protein
MAETEVLSSLGNLFFETGKTDSALFNIHLSNHIATESNYLKVLADNYLLLSKIEESKWNTKSAFQYLKKHLLLKDSAFSTEIFGDINQLQRYYEVSKTNEQIEQLVFKQQMKERTIFYQRIIWIITLVLLLFVSTGLLFIYLQKKRLNKAYKVLFEKNIEIIELQEHSSEKHTEKYKRAILNDDRQSELVERILLIMEDVSIICDTEFSLAKLAVLLQCNHVYVSQIINSAFKKNFRLLLNGYRIKEAQRLFSGSDVEKYTIEYIAKQVGFNSPNAFRSAFREVTGVTPSFYLSSIIENRE